MLECLRNRIGDRRKRKTGARSWGVSVPLRVDHRQDERQRPFAGGL